MERARSLLDPPSISGLFFAFAAAGKQCRAKKEDLEATGPFCQMTVIVFGVS